MSDALPQPSVVDVFADAATPQARRSRPALFKARMAWAARRNQPPARIGGIGAGDRVGVVLFHGGKPLAREGVVIGWERAANLHPGVFSLATLARIRLDDPPEGHPAEIRRRRDALFTLAGHADRLAAELGDTPSDPEPSAC